MTVHAMPVMLGVLAVLAIAYRYYSAFLAARVAALDDSADDARPHASTTARTTTRPTSWVLFGHHFAAISGAGPLIGPVLAIQFGYMPGLIWLVVGVCLAGAVQDMLVLAASIRRGGQSLAEIARAELGPAAGRGHGVAILFIVIIALAGLGFVVVKALGGEEVPMKAGTVLVYPADAGIDKLTNPDGSKVYSVPPGPDYQFGPEADQAMDFHEPFQLAVPPGTALTANPEGEGCVLPEQARRLVPGSSWGTFTIACTIPIALFVGLYMYRIRKGQVVEASLIGAAGVLAATVAGAWIPGSRAGAVLLALARADDLRDRRLRLRRLGAAGLAAALPARLPVQLPQDRHDRPAGRRRDRGQPDARGPDGQPAVRRTAGPRLPRADLPVRLHLHHVRGDLGLPRPGLVGHDAEDDRQGERHPHDRLRRDADRGAGRRRRPDRRRVAAERDVLRHQHRPRQAPAVHPGAEGDGRRPPRRSPSGDQRAGGDGEERRRRVAPRPDRRGGHAGRRHGADLHRRRLPGARAG